MTDVNVVFKGDAKDLKQATSEAKSSIADLKEDVVSQASQMTGASRGLISAVAGLNPAFLAVGAAVAVMGKAYADGVAEVKKMNAEIALGGDISGQTSSSMRALATDMATHSQLTIAESKAISGALASSGQIGAGAFNKIAEAAANYARVTGTDVKAIGPDLVKLFADPAKSAEELNRQMHFLSAAQLDHIAQLQRQGDLTGAQIELVDKYNKRMSEIAPQLGLIERAWKSVEGAASKGWDAMMGAGRPQTVKDKLATIVGQIEDSGTNPLLAGGRAKLMKEAMRLENQANAEAAAAFDKSQAAEKNRRDQAARSLANRLSPTARAAAIDDEIKLLESSELRADVKAEAIAKKREERDKLFAEKKGPKRRDLFADAMADASGLNRNFTEELAALKGGLDAGRVSEEGYIAAVEKLIMKQPFATKGLQEMIKELADKERVLNKVDIAERAANEIVERAGEADAQRAEALATEIEMLGKSAEERARLTEFRKIDARLAKDEARLTDRLGRIGDLDGIDAGVAKLREGAEQAKATWTDAHNTIAARGRDWIEGAKDGLQQYANEAERVAERVADAFKRGAQMAEDAIANFVVTGKLDLTSLLRYAATEIARANIAKPIVSAGTNWLRGLFNGSGGAGSMSGNGSVQGNSDYIYDLHSGGIVGSGEGSGRKLRPMSLFAGAPKYHSGGLAGDEMPAVLKRGEGVFTPGQMRALGGGASNVRIEVVNPPGRPAEVESATPRFDAEGMVVTIVMRDISDGGPIARGMQQKYGLNAAAGTVR